MKMFLHRSAPPVHGASWLLSIALALGGCVSSPPQTIELADVVMEEIGQIEQAHRKLVRAYFAQLEAQVETFIATQWTPGFLDRSMQDEAIVTRLSTLQSGTRLDEELVRKTLVDSGKLSALESDMVMSAIDRSKLDYRVGLSSFMIEFADAATLEIGKVRKDWQTRLRKSERDFMAALDESYGALRAGHLTIRSHLDSVAEVTQMQDRVASELGILEAREQTLDNIAAFSERLAGGVDALNRVIDTLDENVDGPDEAMPLDNNVLQGVLDRLEANVGRAD